MSIKHMAECYELDLSTYATDLVSAKTMKEVLMALADHAHYDGTSARPSVRLIAWKTDLSERSVHRGLARLEEVGAIVAPLPRDDPKRRNGEPTSYLLRLDRIPRKAPLERKRVRQPGTSSKPDGMPDECHTGSANHVADEPSVTVEETSSPPGGAVITLPILGEQGIAEVKVPVRGAVWDGLLPLFGKPGTREAEKHRGRIVGALVGAGITTAEQVAELAVEYRRMFSSEVVMTQDALAKHADLLAHTIRQRQGRRQAKPCEFCGVGGGMHSAECPEASAA